MNKEDAKRAFGENLKRIRIARGFSQDELAKMVGYNNRSSINKIEVGRSGIPSDKVNELAKVLGVSPLDLFQDNGTIPDIKIDSEITALYEKLSPNGKIELMKFAEYLLTREDNK